MTITSTYDHRIIQGAESGMFLRRLDSLLQGDDRFYEQVAETLGITGLGARDSGLGSAPARALPSPEALGPSPDLKHVAAAMALVKAIRNFGHMAARLDPLGHVTEVADGFDEGHRGGDVKAIRNFGHMAARLDPLGSEPPGDPALDPGPKL